MLERPVIELLYEIAGRRVLVSVQDEWCANAIWTLFDGWFLKPLPLNGAANGNLANVAVINIGFGERPPLDPDKFAEFELALGGVCRTNGQRFHLDFDGSAVIFGPGPTRRVDVWLKKSYDPTSKIFTQIISQAFSAVLRGSGLFEFPSAGVVPPGGDQAALIAGESGTGKSTVTLQLAANGWRYLSDDTLLLEQTQGGLAAHALRRFFAVTGDTIQAVQLPNFISPSTLSFKTRVIPQNLFPLGHIQNAKPNAIFFTRLGNSTDTKIHSLRAAEAMTRLLRLCPWAAYDKPTAGEHLALLGELAQRCKSFDFVAAADILEDQSRAASLMDKLLNT